jgi:hypothetical protein
VAGDTAHIPIGHFHELTNIGNEDLTLLVIAGPTYLTQGYFWILLILHPANKMMKWIHGRGEEEMNSVMA